MNIGFLENIFENCFEEKLKEAISGRKPWKELIDDIYFHDDTEYCFEHLEQIMDSLEQYGKRNKDGRKTKSTRRAIRHCKKAMELRMEEELGKGLLIECGVPYDETNDEFYGI